MKTQLLLGWLAPKKTLAQGFKQRAMQSAVQEYAERIEHFGPFDCLGCAGSSPKTEPEIVLWLCDRGPGSQILSSEAVAQELAKVLNSGCKVLRVVIGASDGFSASYIKEAKPALRWSFGPMTLPHELAAVVATEQLYRAWCILKNHPYHNAH